MREYIRDLLIQLLFNYADFELMLKFRRTCKTYYTYFINYNWRFHYHYPDINLAIFTPMNNYKKIGRYQKLIHYKLVNLHYTYKAEQIFINITEDTNVDVDKLKNIIYVNNEYTAMVYNDFIYTTNNTYRWSNLIISTNIFSRFVESDNKKSLINYLFDIPFKKLNNDEYWISNIDLIDMDIYLILECLQDRFDKK